MPVIDEDTIAPTASPNHQNAGVNLEALLRLLITAEPKCAQNANDPFGSSTAFDCITAYPAGMRGEAVAHSASG